MAMVRSVGMTQKASLPEALMAAPTVCVSSDVSAWPMEESTPPDAWLVMLRASTTAATSE